MNEATSICVPDAESIGYICVLIHLEKKWGIHTNLYNLCNL